MSARGEVIVAGPPARAPALVLTAPISFWGGVDPASGRVIDVRHPQCGTSIAGSVLFLPGTIGSSSASSVLLELVHIGAAPAAIVVAEPDAILLMGLVVAHEMGWQGPIALRLPGSDFAEFVGAQVEVGTDGRLDRVRC